MSEWSQAGSAEHSSAQVAHDGKTKRPAKQREERSHRAECSHTISNLSSSSGMGCKESDDVSAAAACSG